MIDKIIEIVDKHSDSNISKNDISIRFIELGINSISFIKIIIDIETEFGIEFDDDSLNINKFDCINSIVKFLA